MSDIDNIPRSRLSLKLLVYPVIALSLGITVYLAGAGIFLAIAIGMLSSVSLVVIRVLKRLISLRSYLRGIGEEAKLSDHKISLIILGVVPFSSKALALSTAPTFNGFLISRLGINRFIAWEVVSEVRNTNFMGKPVLEVIVNGGESPKEIYIPWSKEANEYIPQRLHS